MKPHAENPAPHFVTHPKDSVVQDVDFDLNAFFNTSDTNANTVDTNNALKTDSPETQKKQHKNIFSFKRSKESKLNSKTADLRITLRGESNEVVKNFSTKISADTFNKSSAFVGSATSLFSSLVGSCGPLCLHVATGLTSAGSSVGGGLGAGFSGFGMPSLSADSYGGMHLDGNLSALSQLTGLSQADLASGNFDAHELFEKLSTAFSFGEVTTMMFGFGLFEMIFDSFIDSFITTSRQSNKSLKN